MNYLLKLYIVGQTPSSSRAIHNLKRICKQHFDGNGDSYELELIDVSQHPEKAEEDNVLATPTLLRKLPPPLQAIIGDLSDEQKVISGLGLTILPEEVINEH